jgi:rhamnosyltransferase
MIDKVAATIVLYNPETDVITNIEALLNQVSQIYLIDNSENEIDLNIINFINGKDKLEYIRFNENKGVGEALNTALNLAFRDGYEYLLTLDQDSFVSENMISKLFNIITQEESIALVTAKHFDPSQHILEFNQTVKDILYTMTSGNLVKVSIAKQVGGFDSKLFIDHIDHEFCLKLKYNGYKLKKVNDAILYHKLGRSERRKILGLNFYPSHHSPIRYYYRTRNRLYVDIKYRKIFPEYFKEDIRHFFREFLDMIVCEKQKLKKIYMILVGIIHFKIKKFGRYK